MSSVQQAAHDDTAVRDQVAVLPDHRMHAAESMLEVVFGRVVGKDGHEQGADGRSLPGSEKSGVYQLRFCHYRRLPRAGFDVGGGSGISCGRKPKSAAKEFAPLVVSNGGNGSRSCTV